MSKSKLKTKTKPKPRAKPKPKPKNRRTALGRMLHDAVKKKGISAKEAAKLLNTSESNLFTLYKNPTDNIDFLLDASRKLDVDLLSAYRDQEPLKSLYDGVDKESKKIKEENARQKKHIELLEHTIALQKDQLAKRETK